MNIHYIGFQFLLCGIVCSQHATIANSQTWCMCALYMCVCAFKNCVCACTMEIIYISNLVIGKHQETNDTTYGSKQNSSHLKP
jgi:hypothetical protein